MPTPANLLEFTKSITQTVRNMSDGSLLIIESTVPIGFCNYVKTEIIRDKNIMLAYSPERIDPGNKTYDIINTTKIVASSDLLALSHALSFYNSFVFSTIKSNNFESAEASKLIENAYRLVNISFVNELYTMFDKLDVNLKEALDLAETKEHGFMRFSPSIGAGGHCIPVDPKFLQQHADALNADLPVLDAATVVNDYMPAFYVFKAKDILGDLNGKTICVVGLSYKANSADTRESASIVLVDLLRKEGAVVDWHDSLVQTYGEEHSCDLTKAYDLAIITNRHNTFSQDQLLATNVIDCGK